ncbi:CAMK CAMKL CHK1 protein kinase [Dendrothele bispora CBS 962.96]|uniref:non-specific serine/threonine protein kinase n=1 Tax=Dendrothele bispora (strain CBS 962.96) TaxID=1314807 RepID=A0A4S8L2W9_DENBC|nr:CAMK CAMKL CHK1 protein kinase [Dendrothele bispora CBS 962.96]
MSAKHPKVAGFDLVQQIGGGGFATVYRAVNLSEHRVAACKVIVLSDETSETQRKSIEKEMRIHSVLHHQNVLRFINAVVVEAKHKAMYQPGIYVLMELAAGGDLFDKIAPDIGVADDIAHLYFNQLLDGMEYIHGEGVCHRDLKPENLLLDAAGTLKISDFGLSSVYKLKESGKTRMLTERCGSLPYAAPELSGSQPYAAEPIDVWGIGVILFTLLAGNTPWDEPTSRSPEWNAYIAGEIFDEDPWNRFNQDALSLLCALLTVSPSKRINISQAKAHPWCMRPSQLVRNSVTELADKLTEGLRVCGDLGVAVGAGMVDQDGDVEMGDAQTGAGTYHQSQFTQSLMLFSQTQNGTRYTPHLTRFYSSLPPAQLYTRIKDALEAMGAKVKDSNILGSGSALKLRVGGHDRRKMIFKGWVELEDFSFERKGNKVEGSFCLMQRDVGNPISWRQLWKALIKSEGVEPFVLRK